MKEKVKLIIGLVMFVAIIIIVTFFLNSRNNINQNATSTTNISKIGKIVEVNESNFEKEVINSDKKVLIDFYATWCGPCKMLEPVVEEVANENENLKVVRIDVDKNVNLVYKYNIQAMPTLVVVQNGQEVKRSVGVIPKQNILELCK